MVPKINVYLSDELADAVKAAGVPVSAVCQRALEQAVRRITAIRETALAGLSAEELAAALPNFTARTRIVIQLAGDQARADGAPAVGTAHLLSALIAEGTSLGLRVLEAMEIDPEQLDGALAQRQFAEAPAGAGTAQRFSAPAAAAMEFAAGEAIGFGHNYVGCEHLVLGLIAEPDGTGGQVLRSLGADLRSTRRAVAAALAGAVHLQPKHTATHATPAAPDAGVLMAALHQELRPLVERIERLEERLG
ncbi:ATP-dependent Clp protease ATP-binding subunit ClpC [Allocatelliglobosispora scoriae]|uniref:ATP-dependent Clp protease ATP-binding subunit ClpC n=1 Tax=Allocatelliglobosispora scoriae TaxID=643052 RepID=A0A841BNB2_9ACTN|nr:Clp protease N-terminal domain-containing protein [Allocatelliglobosispora scoriae]MBB5868300.1 ATP-dependent Clp protease ATP-binding subunit ClpC [Allocatelliglobosispora scoriae]